MNKYFYPIYKMKIKPWIKWWILKRLNGGESTLKAVTLSEGTLTKVDKSKALRVKEYYGNTVQDGTPSPESPVEIQTITGENTFTINSNTYRIDLENIELCKIGNYQDKLYYDSGKWYLHKEVGKVILNGTETWKRTQVSASSSYAFWNQYTNLNIPLGKYGQKYCDKFEYQEKIWEQSTPNHLAENNVYTSDLSILFNVDSTIARTVADWKTWLSTHNTTVYYVLATPTTEEITDTNLILQLNALYEFYVQSSTVSISNDSEIPFEFLLEYYGR